MSDSWVCPLTAVASTGNVTQLYPAWAQTGVNPFASMSSGDAIRAPTNGCYGAITVQTDGTNGGTLELYDISGIEQGIDVSSATTITNAQLVAALAARNAKLILSQNFTSTAGAVLPWNIAQQFQKGLAARFWNAGVAGTCVLNISAVQGGFRRTTSPGT